MELLRPPHPPILVRIINPTRAVRNSAFIPPEIHLLIGRDINIPIAGFMGLISMVNLRLGAISRAGACL